MTTFAVTSVSSLRCHTATCFRMGSKFRCIRSTPTEMQSMSENDFEFRKHRREHAVAMSPNFGHRQVQLPRSRLAPPCIASACVIPRYRIHNISLRSKVLKWRFGRCQLSNSTSSAFLGEATELRFLTDQLMRYAPVARSPSPEMCVLTLSPTSRTLPATALLLSFPLAGAVSIPTPKPTPTPAAKAKTYCSVWSSPRNLRPT